MNEIIIAIIGGLALLISGWVARGRRESGIKAKDAARIRRKIAPYRRDLRKAGDDEIIGDLTRDPRA